MPPLAGGSDDRDLISLRSVLPDLAGTQVPGRVTPFFGREAELEALGALLRDDQVRLVTLTGPGGVGKTTLAIELATSLELIFPHGVRYVGLAGVRDAALVASEIMLAAPDGRTCGTLLAAYRDFEGLLVLDNFEHVIAAANEVADLLTACPHLTILVTSRVTLRLSAERVFTVGPLPTSIQIDRLPAGGVEGMAAVQLFVDRARAKRHHFALDAGNASTIAAVCSAVGGLPLGIVLAASHIDVMSPDALLDRLRQRLPLLNRSPIDAPQRHRSIERAIGWSYDLLSRSDQEAMQRLAVFVDGFTLDAAASVLGPGHDALRVIDALVASSLVAVSPGTESGTRYSMLEPIRDFALAHLQGDDGLEDWVNGASTGEAAAVRDRHASWCAEFAEWSDWAWFMAPQEGQPRLASLDAETANLRAALDWLSRRGDRLGMLRMAMRLGGLWIVLGHPDEGIRWLSTGLRETGEIPPVVRARALAILSWCVNTAGDPVEALARAEESLALWRQLDDRIGLAQALMLSGVPAIRVDGREQDALGWFEEGLEIVSGIETPPWIINMRGMFALQLGVAALQRRDIAGAERHLGSARDSEAARGFGLGTSYVYGAAIPLELAYLARAQGDHDAALELYRKALLIARDTHNLRALSHALAGIAGTLALLEAGPEASRVFGASQALHERLGFEFAEAFDRQQALGLPEPWTTDGESFGQEERLRDPSPLSSGLDVAAKAWAEGRTLSLDAAIALALAAKPGVDAERSPGPVHTLSHREVEVLRLLVDGMTDGEIAAALYISRRTAATHVRHIYDKLGVSSRAVAAAWAVRHGIA